MIRIGYWLIRRWQKGVLNRVSERRQLKKRCQQYSQNSQAPHFTQIERMPVIPHMLNRPENAKFCGNSAKMRYLAAF